MPSNMIRNGSMPSNAETELRNNPFIAQHRDGESFSPSQMRFITNGNCQCEAFSHGRLAGIAPRQAWPSDISMESSTSNIRSRKSTRRSRRKRSRPDAGAIERIRKERQVRLDRARRVERIEGPAFATVSGENLFTD